MNDSSTLARRPLGTRLPERVPASAGGGEDTRRPGSLESRIENDLDELVEFRRDLHRHPELLYDLPRTSARVRDALAAAGVDELVTGLGRTGVVGIVRGRVDTGGRMIGLRADMDALPIVEESGMAWSSTVPGLMHGCGHDGHTAMLVGAARELVRSREFDGTVALIFQPAEEGGAGAQAMIDDGLFERFPMQEVYGLHNRPGIPVGHFAIRPGPMLAAADEIRIEVIGKGGHAARPEETIDPIAVSAALLQSIQTIVSRSVDPVDAAVVSITSIHGGDTFNVIPGKVTLARHGAHPDRACARADRAAPRRDRRRRRRGPTARRSGSTTSAATPSPSTTSARPPMPSPRRARSPGAGNVDAAIKPSLGGEDFAFLLEHCPGAMIFAGNGDTAGLHHPAYDFDDASIPWGCAYWTTLVGQRLPIA